MRKGSQYNVKISPKKGEEGIARRRKADRCERGMTEGDRMNKGLHSPGSIFGYLSVCLDNRSHSPPLPMVGMVEEMVVVVALGQWIKPCRLLKEMPHLMVRLAPKFVTVYKKSFYLVQVFSLVPNRKNCLDSS